MLNKPLRKIRASRAKRELAIFSEAPPNLAQISSKFAEIAQLVEHDLAKVGVASSSLVFRSKSTSAIAGVLFSRKTLDCAKFFLLTPVLRTSPVREYRLRFAFGGRLRGSIFCDDVHENGRKVGVFHASATDFVHFSSHSKIVMPRRPISCIFQVILKLLVWRKTTDFWAKTVNFSSIWHKYKIIISQTRVKIGFSG